MTEEAKLGTVEQPIPLVVGEAVILWATPGEQMGLPYVAGRCPKCTHQLALSGYGFTACIGCNQWLEFRNIADKPK